MRLGKLLLPGDTICLTGELGSGKTTLVQGIAAGWGSLDPVSSPTYVLVNVYRRPPDQKLFHLDAYRISRPEEAFDLDIDNLLEQGPLVIEWAENIASILPTCSLKIRLLHIDTDQRDMLYTVHGERYEKLLLKFRRQVFGSG